MIKLTNVCHNFNQTIGSSKELMDKIRLRVSPNNESRSFYELENVLRGSMRKYEHISLNNAQCDDSGCIQFIKNHNIWKSLKLSTCHFSSVDSKAAFLSLVAPNLEEAEFENVIIDQLSVFNKPQQPVRTVLFPKLVKLKSGTLTADFYCTSLKALDLSLPNQNRIWQLLRLNQQLEDFTMTYEVLDAIFKRDIVELGINLKLKKIHLQRHHGSDPMDITSNRNFQTFLKSQSETVEELVIDWYSGRPPAARRASSTNDWFSSRSCRRMRGEGNDRGARNPQVMRFQRRRFVDDDFNPADDICVKAITMIFQDFKVIRKLIVSDKQGFLSDTSCPSVTVLNLIPNPSITELRLRFEKAPLSDVLFEKLVSACPNVKNLFVHEMDQSLLECCARRLKNIESIFALSFKVDCLPSDKVKFKKLTRVNFCECVVSNHPELNGQKLKDQKAVVLKNMI